jgi:RNA-directed DNA polymerase
MTQLLSLKAATSLHDVAALLGFSPKGLSYILYKKLPEAKYRSFQIQKRRGGFRQINAPSPDLLLLQQHLSDLLQNCVEEINKAQNRKDDFAHGFKRRRSIISNATKHRRRRFVLNIDLQDFFGTINFGRVRGFFIKDRNFAVRPEVATVLAQIACYQNSLPQGSPCSPVISNLVGHLLDIRLGKLAFDTGCTYSRYADDITFSTNKPQFPSSIARLIPDQNHTWEVSQKLQEIVTRTGFAINTQKTRMQYRTSRQDVTGLVVNSKVNIRSEYRRTVRAMAHRLFMTGRFERIETVPVPDANGVLAPTKKEGTLV